MGATSSLRPRLRTSLNPCPGETASFPGRKAKTTPNGATPLLRRLFACLVDSRSTVSGTARSCGWTPADYRPESAKPSRHLLALDPRPERGLGDDQQAMSSRGASHRLALALPTRATVMPPRVLGRRSAHPNPSGPCAPFIDDVLALRGCAIGTLKVDSLRGQLRVAIRAIPLAFAPV